jgi:hypothetical protein
MPARNNYNNNKEFVVLMVAEKPSIAKSITEALCGNGHFK